MDFIEIKGYKSIRDAKIELKPINILIGANGSGKSNFLSFFRFINKAYQNIADLNRYVELNGGAEKMLHNGVENSTEIYSELSFDNGNNVFAIGLQKTTSGFFLVSRGEIWLEKEKKDNLSLGDLANFASLDLQGIEIFKDFFNSLRTFHFGNTGGNSPFNEMSSINNDVYYLYENGKNLAAFLYNIQQQHTKRYRLILKIIQSVAPYISNFFLLPNEKKFIRFHWKDRFSETVFGIDDLSDGTIRFIALAALFMQPNLPKTIIIDEPELGLHPFAIAKLAGLIQSAAAQGCQVIVATQSADLISHFEPEDIVTVDQIEGKSNFKRLNSKDLAIWLDDYSTIDDLWKRSIIESGQPNYR